MNNSILKFKLVKTKYGLILSTLFLLMACSNISKPYQFYPGAKRSNAEVAIINNVTSGLLSGDSRLMAINGILGPEGPAYGYSSLWDGKFNVELLPGKYDISIMLNADLGDKIATTNQFTLEFEAKAGHIYHLKNEIILDEFGADTARFYIEDMTDKEKP